MKNRPLVSVILPVYNPGPGVEKCIDSLRGQTLKDIEMIFVDDLGTDDSMDKIRAAAAQDARIRILTNEKNLGQGLSRNAGIEAARGEYLSFVDPDDFIAPDFLRLLYDRAHGESLDIVRGTLRQVIEGEGPEASVPADGPRNAIIQGLEEQKPLYVLFRNHHWTALYRREFLLASGARYGSTRNAEDSTFLLRACHAARSFALCEDAVYYYVQRPNSAVRVFNAQRLESQLLALKEQFAYLAESVANDKFARGYADYRISYYLQIQLRAAATPGLEADAARFLRDVREEVGRLPFAEQLAQNSFRTRALLEYGANLSDAPLLLAEESAPPADTLLIVTNWVDFALAHPGFAPNFDRELARVMKSAFQVYMDMVARAGMTKETDAFYRSLRQQREKLTFTQDT